MDTLLILNNQGAHSPQLRRCGITQSWAVRGLWLHALAPRLYLLYFVPSLGHLSFPRPLHGASIPCPGFWTSLTLNTCLHSQHTTQFLPYERESKLGIPFSCFLTLPPTLSFASSPILFSSLLITKGHF